MGNLKKKEQALNSFRWLIWDFSGIRLVWEKIFPPVIEPKRKPSSFMFWSVGFYISLFSLTSTLYDSRYKIIDNKINFIFSQQKTENWNSAVEQLPIIQRSPLPNKPEFSNPLTVIGYFLITEKPNQVIIRRTKKIILSNKKELSNTNLKGIDLSGLNLMHAKFDGCNLEKADLSGCLLVSASFKNCFLSKANFNNSILCSANFENAFLYQASFKDSVLRNFDLGTGIESMTELKKGIFVKDRIIGTNYHGLGIVKDATLIENQLLVVLWQNENVNIESEKQFKSEAKLERAVLSEAIWVDGNQCAITSIGSCISVMLSPRIFGENVPE